MDEEFIVSAAINYGMIISLPAPARHGTILIAMQQVMQIPHVIGPQYQGFITSTGRYVNRVEAYEIAWKAGQIIEDKKGPELFSEDLW